MARRARRRDAEPRAGRRRLVRPRHAAPALRRAHRRHRAGDARPYHGGGLDRGRVAPPAHRQPRRHARGRDAHSPGHGDDMKAKVNGIEVNYEIHGKEGAPWLTFSHSLACSLRMWDPQVAAFKDRWHILLYDTRGHGATEAPKGAYTLDMLAGSAPAARG